jgi:hypothetical protein
MNDIFSCNFPNQGFVGCKLSDTELDPVLTEINKISSNFDLANSKLITSELVGHINREYALIDSLGHIESLVEPLIKIHQSTFGAENNILNKKFILRDAWVNFQKKHEFNPLHRHSGSYSFVIYIKIPYSMKDENSYFPSFNEAGTKAGTFSFQYINALGKISEWNLPTDAKYEKSLILFPAEMFHEVHPFYSSDDYRISVSGNIVCEAY